MPRGDDTQQALKELADEFGKGVGNAEQLIEANLAMRPDALRKAEHLPRDEELTSAAREEHVGKKHGPGGEVVIDAAVRRSQSGVGDPITTIVYRDEDGRDFIGVLDEKGKPVKPDLSAADAVAERSPKPSPKDKA